MPLVKWFLFQDDDVYWRPEALLGILSQHSTEKPLALAYETHWVDSARRPRGKEAPTSAAHTRGFNDQHVPKKHACSVDCVHGFPWMMASALSVAAVQAMAPAAAAGGLQRACGVSGLSHDGGLGMFAKIHGVSFVSLDPETPPP
jgi:hypothetical protein